MKLNWRPQRVAFLDFETQSECPLTTVHKYATHESTRALTCVVRVDGVEHRFGPYLDADAKSRLAGLTEGRTVVAHNAPFDAVIWELTEGLPEREWFDTLPASRAAGLPGALDAVGLALTGEGKDKSGKRLIDLLCILKPGQKVPAVGPAHGLLMEYNARDVQLLEQVYNHVKDHVEPGVMTVDRVINDRGVPVDREYLLALMELYDVNETRLRAEFVESTGGVNPGSAKQVKEWMQRMGFRVPQVDGRESIGRFALKDFFSRPDDFYVGDGDEDAAVEALTRVMDMRSEVVRVGRGKADAAMQALESDDRVREQFVYWGAHTGRWSGRGLQLHNMPKQEIDVRSIEPTYGAVCAIADEATARLGYRVLRADVLNGMLRAMVRADNLLVADYGAVEARGIGWVAGCTKMVELYSDPHKSVYLDLGRKLFSREISKDDDPHEYTMAKTLVLGCGYGMSGAKFEYTCKSRCISTAVFSKAGMTAAEGVKAYREAYPEIPWVWKAYHGAVHSAVRGSPTEAGRCNFYMYGPHLHMRLPSGRVMVYRNARIEPRIPGYCKLYGMPETPVDTVVFDKPRSGGFGFLYGSKIAENAVQAVCRDFLAHALMCMDQAGLDPILHVHDEIVCVAPPSRLPEFMEIMSTPPPWAPDFPVLVEGYSGPVWSKIAKGYHRMDYLNGRLVKEVKP